MMAVRVRLSHLGRVWSLPLWTATRFRVTGRTLAVLLSTSGISFQFPSGAEKLGVQDGLSFVHSSETSSPSDFLQVGEELQYRVSFWFIGLGEIRLKVTDQFQKDGETRYRAEAYIDSYKGNPFANLHEFYETEFDTGLYTHSFQGHWLSGGDWRYVKYDFRYDINKIFIEKGRYDLQKVEKYDTVDINRRYQDGLSLFYFARGYVKSGQKTVIPTFINEKKGRTYFDFMNKSTDQDIDSVSYPINVVEFEGDTDWVGVFGLTGGFRGWFSNDDARIPIVARMKVIIGSVKLQLQDWKRGGWTPPRYSEGD